MVKYLDKDGLVHYTDILKTKLQELKQLGRYLSNWDATKGLPTTNPGSPSYNYFTGDYYLVSKVATTEQEKNYKPVGTIYIENTPSTTEETNELSVSDIYLFDGTKWLLLRNTQKTVSFANLAGEPSDNTNLKNALDNKVSFTDYASGSTVGVVKTSSSYAVTTSSNGYIQAQVKTKEQYVSLNNSSFISKGTLENIKESLVKDIGDTKYQPIIEDLDTIKSNAEAGKEAKETIDTYGDIVTHNVSEFQEAGDYATNTDLTNGLNLKQDVIENLSTIESNAQAGKSAKDTIDTYGDIVTHNVNEFQVSGDYATKTELSDGLSAKQDITDNSLVTLDKTVPGAINELDAKIKEIELFKSPNVLIQGEPTINNGQVTNFSRTNYLILPFEFNVGDRGFELTYAFRTGTDITTPQNLFGSKFSIASYIQNSKLTIRISSNGTSWDILDLITSLDIQANTTYYIKLIFNRLNYIIKSSTDGVEYSQIGSVVDTRPPFAGDVYIGIGNNQNNPFLGMINLHKWELKYNNSIFWEGMDDAGLATRADISLSNLDDIGQAKFDAKQNKLIAGDNIIIDEQTNIISSTGGGAEIIFRKWSED